MAEMLSWHKPGQKVSCLDDSRWNMSREFNLPYPKTNEVCTIFDIRLHPCTGNPGFLLLEFLDNDIYYIASNFVPVFPDVIEDLKRLDAPLTDSGDEEFEDAERRRELTEV